MSRTDIVAMLTALRDGIDAGSFRIASEDGEVTVDVPAEVTLEFEAETEDGDSSLELELEWSGPGIEIETTSDDVPEENRQPGVSVEPASQTATLARFEVFRDRSDEWRWRLRHQNGNVIATSGEGYTRKHNARKGLRSVVRNAPDADIADETDL